MRMHHIVICDLSVVKYFSALSHKRHDFQKECFESKMCILIFSKFLSEIFLILVRTELYVIENVYWSSCRVPLLLVRF